MKNIISSLFILSALYSSMAFAFEIDGLKSGMARSEAQQALLNQRYSISEVPSVKIGNTVSEGWINASHLFKPELTVYFCHNRLSSIAEHLPDEYNGKDYTKYLAKAFQNYGNPINMLVTDVEKYDVQRVVHFWKIKPNEGLRISYDSGKKIVLLHDSLDGNSCGAQKLYNKWN